MRLRHASQFARAHSGKIDVRASHNAYRPFCDRATGSKALADASDHRTFPSRHSWTAPEYCTHGKPPPVGTQRF